MNRIFSNNFYFNYFAAYFFGFAAFFGCFLKKCIYEIV